ncbi:MAG: hypothetical protein ACI30M_02995 [Muribaculaceae bacterium]
MISNLCYAENWSGTHAGTTNSTDGSTITINLTGNVTLTSTIEAGVGITGKSSPRNAKIIIQNATNGPVTISKGSGLGTFLRVWEGATIHVKGSSGKEIILDAGGGTSAEMIASTGNLKLEYVTLKNHTNTNLSKDGKNTPYCAIKLACLNDVVRTMGTTTIDHCLFENIHCQVGSVLYAPSHTKDHADNNRTNNKITISNTVINNCSATKHDGGTESDEITPSDAGGGWGGIIRTKGGWVGDMELNNVTIQDCSAEFCCAGVFWNACGQAGNANRQPYLTIKGCKFLNNTAKISGGAIRIEAFCEFKPGDDGSPTEIAYNSAGVMGGGIHIYGYAGGNMGAFDFKYDLKALYIHDNTAQYGGGIGVQITPKCTLSDGTKFNINFDGAVVNDNKAKVKGGGIYYENIADASKNFTINLYLNSGSINGNIVAPDPDKFEFGKTVAKGSAFYDTTEKEDEYKSCGGAVYLYKANIKYDSSKPGQMTMNDNKASVYGGAIFVTGKLASLNLQSLSASRNEAQRGAAIACISIAEDQGVWPRPNPETYATRVTLGDATLSGNIATEDGGGAYLVRGKLTVENNAVFSGNKAGHGGAIHTKYKSILTIGKATFENNTASANGGAIYVEDGCNINITDNAVFRGNRMESLVGGGGAICAKNNNWTSKENFDFVTANIKNAIFENNYSGYRGGAIELDGLDQSGNVDFTLENATFTGNEAKIGGAILVNEAKLTYKGGLIYGNRAVKTPGSSLPKTSYGYFPYNWNANCYHSGQFSGFGGGIAISKDGQFIIENSQPFGIYGNSADIAGNDISTICSDKAIYNGGSNMDKSTTYDYKYFPKTLTIPQPEELNLSGFKIPLPKSAVKWMEDYNSADGAYHLGTKRQDVTSHKRYGELLNDSEGIKKLSGLIVDDERMKSTPYLHLTLGYNFIFVKLVKKGLKAGDTSIFNISYKDGSNYVKYMTVSLTNTSATDGAETSRIIALSAGNWKIEETDWAWDYDRPAAQEFTLNVDPDATKMRTFTFTNSPQTKPAPNGEGYKINNGMTK